MYRDTFQLFTLSNKTIRPVAKYSLPPHGDFVDHDFLEASCHASFFATC